MQSIGGQPGTKVPGWGEFLLGLAAGLGRSARGIGALGLRPPPALLAKLKYGR